ncbi:MULTISPECIES: FecR family protein [Olivibacter]|jgi:ferric-dicitrate binding protein FerR (iron transport regulator)|uniref:FecR family protein n=2 Tax=Olivibacter TaxID=376469 RepID=A0ABW6B665_9SPHI|nr:FecR family protein [Pseudosphingobacterium sp.]
MAAKFTNAYIKELAYKWERGLLTDSEKADFEAWYNSHNDKLAEISANYDAEEVIKNRLLNQLVSHMGAGHTEKRYPKRRFISWIAVAAILLLMFSIGTFVYVSESVGFKQSLLTNKNDINPGRNKAILTLADGRKINLDAGTDGAIAEENGMKITKTADGQLIYEVVADPVKQGRRGDKKAEIVYNTIETPKGGQYKIVLPDRSYVWLNAASTLKYPTDFTQENRTVELKGEAYFEIQPDKYRPFIVKNEHQITKVLGTQFNISAYNKEEAVKTTLVEGAVSVVAISSKENAASALTTLLKPGEQSTVHNGKTSVLKVDVAPYIAWKKGVFYFDETKITDAMNQLSRWYDVEIVYKGDVPDTYFYGEISRKKSLSAVLAILEEGGVKFKIDKTTGTNKLIVY